MIESLGRGVVELQRPGDEPSQHPPSDLGRHRAGGGFPRLSLIHSKGLALTDELIDEWVGPLQ